jgi:predicted  nucleic acid-binding Zn-ribbon protein
MDAITEEMNSRAYAQWLQRAYEVARNSPAFRDELAQLEGRIDELKKRQYAALEPALTERRTTTYFEGKNFDAWQWQIRKCQSRIRVILSRALPDARFS